MSNAVNPSWISGFWRRIGALILDTIILGILGISLGLFFESLFVQMGSWGRLVGFTIALTYFGIMNSSVMGGQTLGKRLLKIRVVDTDNNPILLGKSFLRASVLALPFSLNGAQLSNELLLSFFIYPLTIIIFGGVVSIIYLYLFNRVTRQSLHDLVAGTFVVNTKAEIQAVGSVWKVHKIVVAVLFFAAAIIPVFTLGLTEDKPYSTMLSTHDILTREEPVSSAVISIGTTTTSSLNEETQTITYVSTEIRLNRNEVANPDLAKHLALLIASHYPEAISRDVLQVTLSYGYDIGIASRWLNKVYNFDPQKFELSSQG